MTTHRHYMGAVFITPELSKDDLDFLTPIWTSPRKKLDMKKVAKKLNMDYKLCQMTYGDEGEFKYTTDSDPVIDNSPPGKQPSSHCPFYISNSSYLAASSLQWTQGCTTDFGVEWIKYFVDLLTRDGYQCNGEFQWESKDFEYGIVKVKDGEVTCHKSDGHVAIL